MLVLSRREGEKIVFPTIGVTINVLRVKGNTSRLGIKAPPHVKVLRDELVGDAEDAVAISRRPLSELARFRHDVLNRLNSANLALQLYRRQIAMGREEEAAVTFQKILEEFEALEKEAVATRDAAVAPTKPAARLKSKAAPRRALLVEDDANECELLAGFLRLSGFDVDTAGDGSDAIDYLDSHHRPDVVLLDMLMPRCDGPTTVGQIRSQPRYEGLKVFAISGTPPASLGVTTGPRGIDRWFRKPVNPERLVEEIQRELAGAAHVG